MAAQHPRGAQVAAAVVGQHLVARLDVLDRLRGAVGHRDRRPGDQALVVVAHHAEVPVLLRQQLQPAVLGPVRVLVLVDEDVAEGAAVAVSDLLEELEQVHAAEEQVVEVHRVRRVEALLVEVVDVGRRLLEEGRDLQAVGLGVEQLVLGVRDLAADAAGREPLRVHVQLVHARLHQPQRVLLVIDREAAGVAELVGVGAQHAGAGGVEGHHPHRAGAVPHELLHPLAHLLRGLVGEGDGEDLARPRLPGAHQVGDPVGQDARLARSRAGEDEQGPLSVENGLALGLVQPLQQGIRGQSTHPVEDRAG